MEKTAMLFKRNITPPETKVLGNHPERELHAIIDAALKRRMNSTIPDSVESRILTLLTKVKPMTAREITEAHNALFGNNAITISYTRFVLSGMFNAGMVKREGRGKYVK